MKNIYCNLYRMLKLKKQNLNIVLGLVLVGLMYHTPRFLYNLATNLLGRAVLVIVLVYLAVICDFSCAVIFSLIIIVLFQNTIEGMDHMDAKTEEDVEKEKKQAELEEGNQENVSEEEKMSEGMMREGNENMEADGDEEESASDQGKEKLNAGTDAASAEFGVSLKRPINSLWSFFGATAQNAMGLSRVTRNMTKKEGMETEEMENKEGFLGMNLVNNIGSITRNVRSSLSNITDLDRRLKTSAESNTIASTKDFH